MASQYPNYLKLFFVAHSHYLIYSAWMNEHHPQGTIDRVKKSVSQTEYCYTLIVLYILVVINTSQRSINTELYELLSLKLCGSLDKQNMNI